MKCTQSSTPTSVLVRLWHRYNVRRAMRIYRRVPIEASKLEAEKAWADELMRRHADPPQQNLPGID